jgi:lipopolysaccharide/colanic/teichoic acid biosynthesis glycosyltransferase
MSGARGGLQYCLGTGKRAFDLSVSLLLLLLLSPVLACLALLVLVASGPPVLFRQERIGRGGRPFILMKFRTMRRGSDRALLISALGDRRVTPLGRVLRATKLDELPQLINVVRGEMSLVGPRPEVRKYVASYDSRQRRVLDVRPGLTDPASVLFRNEEETLGAVDEKCREDLYVRTVLPKKLEMNLAYIDGAGFCYDMFLILATLKAVLFRSRA